MKKNILVLEDDPLSQKIIVEALLAEGHEVLVFQNLKAYSICSEYRRSKSPFQILS